MIKKLNDYQTITYFIITFVFTWIFWSIAFNSTSSTLNGTLRIVGSFMPSIMAIIFTGYYDGVNGIKKMLDKLIIWKVNPFFYAFIFLYTALSIYLPTLICSIIGINYKINISNHISNFQLTSPITTIVGFLAVMIFGGPIGEEIGWRGFALPKLQSKLNPIVSSIILGAIWASWHIPMFYFHVSGYDISFISYLLETIWLTILFTWVYNNTKGSLLMVILYHSFDNFIMAICFNDFMSKFNMYSIIFWLIRLVVLLYITFDMIKKRKNKLNIKIDN